MRIRIEALDGRSVRDHRWAMIERRIDYAYAYYYGPRDAGRDRRRMR